MSTVILDTITGKSTATTVTIGSTPVVSASANSMTIRGEGSAQTSIQQGLAKAWLEGSPAAALADSFNISGGTDNGTGDYSYAYSNNMNGTNYSITDSCHSSGLSATDNGSQATNGFKLQIFQRGNSTLGSAIDNVNYGSIHGDLA